MFYFGYGTLSARRPTPFQSLLPSSNNSFQDAFSKIALIAECACRRFHHISVDPLFSLLLPSSSADAFSQCQAGCNVGPHIDLQYPNWHHHYMIGFFQQKCNFVGGFGWTGQWSVRRGRGEELMIFRVK